MMKPSGTAWLLSLSLLPLALLTLPLLALALLPLALLTLLVARLLVLLALLRGPADLAAALLHLGQRPLALAAGPKLPGCLIQRVGGLI